jgi:hypothetical protein
MDYSQLTEKKDEIMQQVRVEMAMAQAQDLINVRPTTIINIYVGYLLIIKSMNECRKCKRNALKSV